MFSMKIFALADLHLSFSNKFIPQHWDEVEEYKPMACFGNNWKYHFYKIYQNWCNNVSQEDIVLIPGDISWASDLKELEFDLAFMDLLPGKKVLIRGNHDYWWQGIKKLRDFFPANFYLLQNDSLKGNGFAIAGSRGWTVPNSFQFSDHDLKIYQRELIRLELSLKNIGGVEVKKIVILHYMPVNESHEKNELIDLLLDYEVDICIYGHLHGKEAHNNALTGKKWGIEFHLVSSDYLDFNPKFICKIG